MAYIFAGYSFDSETGLKFGAKEIILPPKERALLHFLLRSAGKTVSKDDVVRDVWRGGVASDESISRAVYRLRLAMQAAGGPPVVTTVYNGGFRISAVIHERLREPGSSVAELMLSRQAHRVLPMIISGREFAARLSPQDISNALRAANAAALADPGYVPAWVAIAEFHVLQAIRSALAPRLAGQLALAAAHHALELNADCGPALAIRGWVLAMIEGHLRSGLEQLVLGHLHPACLGDTGAGCARRGDRDGKAGFCIESPKPVCCFRVAAVPDVCRSDGASPALCGRHGAALPERGRRAGSVVYPAVCAGAVGGGIETRAAGSRPWRPITDDAWSTGLCAGPFAAYW